MDHINFIVINSALLLAIVVLLAFNFRGIRYFIRSSKVLRMLFKQTESMNRHIRTVYQVQISKQDDLKNLELRMANLQQQVTTANAIVVQLRNTVTDLIQTLESSANQQKEPVTTHYDEKKYEYAKKLLQKGCALEEIVKEFQLSNDEAEILKALYSKERSLP